MSNRLRLMNPPEIGHRIKDAVQTRAERMGMFTVKNVPSPDLGRPVCNWLNHKIEVAAPLYLAEADAVLKGRFKVFALANAGRDAELQWNRDPKTGIVAPLKFGKTLDYRDPELVGDVKYLWEPNRHLQIVRLAQAYFLSGERRYAAGIKEQLNSWFHQCPYLLGPNWTSSLELAIRLINWSFVWQLCGGAVSPMFDGQEGDSFRKRWLESIYQHAHFVRGYFSRHSSANNHLIGEAAGLFVAATTWPYWETMAGWQKDALYVLTQEVLRQNGPDGVNREQAISYQQFVLDFMLISGIAGKANNIEFPDSYWERMERMLEYIASVMDVNGNVPMVGDADDGYVVRLSPEPDFCPYKSLLATGAVLYKRGDFRRKARELDDKTRWLLGEEKKLEFSALEPAEHVLPVRREFPDGGYYILGCNFEAEDEIRLIVDSGPLGYLSIAAHGHADALAFTLFVSGREFLIDPGTYAYHTQKEWRDYFRGTSAHNTVRVDAEDQSVSGGNFMWINKAVSVCKVWESGEEMDLFVGEHDGYLRLNDPVMHSREIKLNKAQKTILVIDTLTCNGTHNIERFWHFSENCSVLLEKGVIKANNNGVGIILKNGEGADMEARILHGETTPPAGWISREFDKKIPSTTVAWQSSIKGTTRLITEIICGHRSSADMELVYEN